MILRSHTQQSPVGNNEEEEERVQAGRHAGRRVKERRKETADFPNDTSPSHKNRPEKRKARRREKHTHKYTSMNLSSFFLSCYPALEYGNGQQIHLEGHSRTHTHTHTWIFYRPECYPFIPRGHTHTDLTKKATVYLTTASFSSLKKKFQTKARKKKKRIISRYDLSLSMYMCVCWPMPQPTAAHYWFPHSEEKKEMIRERIQ